MNKAYKVVFNKVRGTLMVVNEATSSIQKKGAKTVVATAALAMIAGVAGAEPLDNTKYTGTDPFNISVDNLIVAAPNMQISGVDNNLNKVSLLVNGADLTLSNKTSITFNSANAATNNPSSTPGTKCNAIGIINGGKVTIETAELNLGTNKFDSGNKGGDRGFRLVGSGNTLNIHANKIVSYTGDEFVHVRQGNGTSVANIGTADKRIGEFYAETGWGKDDYGVAILQANEGNTINFFADKATFVGSSNIAGGVFGSGSAGKINVDANTLTIDGNLCGTYGGQSADTYKNDVFDLKVKAGSLVLEGSINAGSADTRDSQNVRTANITVEAAGGSIIGNINAYKRGNISVKGIGEQQLKMTGSVLATQIAGLQALTTAGTSTIKLENIAITPNEGQVAVTAKDHGTITFVDKMTVNANNEGVAIKVGINGKLEVQGSLTLSGYIQNAGTVTFADGSKVSLVLTDDMIKAGEYQLIEGNGDWNKAKLGENTLYDIAWDGDTGKVSIAQKSAESLVESLPVTSQQAGTIAAVLPTATAPATPELGQIANAIRSAASGEEIAQIAEDLAPSTAPVVSSVSQGVNNAIAGVANARMAANRAAGDVFTGGSAWAQMIYNSADQDATKKTAKLESDTYGITVGIDGKIGDNLTIGAGFGVTKTDAESGTRDIDVDSYALFGYTEYNADNGWFMNGMVNAIRGRYEENKAPAGIKLTAKYQTTVLGAGVATGYHFENGISPEVGLRYLRTHQGSYNDGAQKIHTDGTNLLTASIGAKYEKAFEQGDWVLKPSARVAATYDVVSDDTESAIRVIGGGQYHVISAHQKRAAYEAGIGLEASNGDWDFSVSYNGEFRSHFQSHTGMLKAKYNF